MSNDRVTFPFAASILPYIPFIGAKALQVYHQDAFTLPHWSLDSLLLEFAGIQLVVYILWRILRGDEKVSYSPFGILDETSDECLWFGMYGSFGLLLVVIYTTQANLAACLPLGLLLIIASFTKYLDYQPGLQNDRDHAEYFFTKASPEVLARWYSKNSVEYFAQFYPFRKPTLPEYFYPDYQAHISLWIPFVEFAFEAFFLPQWKLNYYTLVISGIATSIGLMLTWNRAIEKYHRHDYPKYFSVSWDFDENSKIFSYVWSKTDHRHPLYRAQLYYALSLQIILLNPLSAIGMIIPLWLSLREQIHQDEAAFINKYGDCYREYQASIPSGVPFIDYELWKIEPIFAYL